MKCTTHHDFQRVMTQMSLSKPQAVQDFQSIGVMKFCRAYISEWPNCEVVDNNICECFNNYILQARSKRIIDMLEDIRVVVMQRFVEKKELFSNTTDEVLERCSKITNSNLKNAVLNTQATIDSKFQRPNRDSSLTYMVKHVAADIGI